MNEHHDPDLSSADGERADLLAELAERRWFLRNTLRDLTAEQALSRPAASELCLAGLVQHVTDTEEAWAAFIRGGAPAMDAAAAAQGDREERFRPGPGTTPEAVLAEYEAVAERTTELVLGLATLDDGHTLPVAPWFPPDTTWSARRVLLHMIGETAHHAGHADIIREAIDGAKSMG
jgi:uncharacterized damage-inducible protein DinB